MVEMNSKYIFRTSIDSLNLVYLKKEKRKFSCLDFLERMYNIWELRGGNMLSWPLFGQRMHSFLNAGSGGRHSMLPLAAVGSHQRGSPRLLLPVSDGWGQGSRARAPFTYQHMDQEQRLTWPSSLGSKIQCVHSSFMFHLKTSTKQTCQ